MGSIELHPHAFQFRGYRELLQRGQLFPRRRHVPGPRQRPAPRVVPERQRMRPVGRRRRRIQDLLPALEAHLHLQRTAGPVLQEVHAGHPEHICRDQARDLAGGIQRFVTDPDHRRREGQEIIVVRVIAHCVHARARLLVGDIGLVCVHGVAVLPDRIEVASDADIDVPGHVHDVASARHQVGETLRTGDGALGVNLLHGVDVEMAGARVLRILLDDPFEAGKRFRDPGLGLALRRPVVPGTQRHQGLAAEHGDIRIVRPAPCDLPHGFGISRVQVAPVFLRLRRIALGECVEQCTFAR